MRKANNAYKDCINLFVEELFMFSHVSELSKPAAPKSLRQRI